MQYVRGQKVRVLSDGKITLGEIAYHQPTCLTYKVNIDGMLVSVNYEDIMNDQDESVALGVLWAQARDEGWQGMMCDAQLAKLFLDKCEKAGIITHTSNKGEEN
jgi:hypothetical protein